jgi:hypothetical protein
MLARREANQKPKSLKKFLMPRWLGSIAGKADQGFVKKIFFTFFR